MPTTRPRLSITLTEPVHAVLERFSQLTEQSMSSVIVEFMQQASPQLERLCVMMEAVKEASPEAMAQVKRTLDRTEAVLESHAGAMMTSLDLFTAPIARNVPEVASRASQKPSQAEAGAGVAVPPGRLDKSPRSAKNPPAPNRGGSSQGSEQKIDVIPSSKVVRIRDRKAPA